MLSASVSPLEAAAPLGQWWDATYKYREKLNLTAGTAAIPAQYSVSLPLDHAGFVSIGQSLASGNDVRIAWWSGSTWVELDRLLDDQSAWNNAATRIWFRTQAAIGASATDDNYYLYYGNPGAGAPPANWANVFLLYDDFNDGVFDPARWGCSDPFGLSPPAVCTESAVAPGTLSLDTDSQVASAAGFAFGTNTRWESRLRLATDTAPVRNYNYWGASQTIGPGIPYVIDWVTFWCNTAHTIETANNSSATLSSPAPAIGTPTAYHVYTFDREGATNVRFFQDGIQVGNLLTTIPDGNLRALVFNDEAVANGIVLDWVRVRRYVTPEPTFTTNLAENGPAGMRVLSGTYTGNGVNNRPIFVGFPPDVVFVDRFDPANPGTNDEAVLRTTTMPAGLSKFVDGGGGIALAANGITSLDPQGFTVGTDNNVNQTGLTYYWVAFQAAPGQLRVGTYGGTGVAQDITTVGFSPAYVLSISASAHNTVQKTSLMPANFSQDFTANGFTDAVLNMRPDGFRVGTNVIANNNGTTYHYVAWGAVSGKVAVGSYTGGAPVDNRDITGTGFFPEWVIVSRSSNAAGSQANSPAHKPASSGVGVDFAVLFDGAFAESNNIQNLQANGFQVGSHNRVNVAGAPNTYHWVAFGPHAPTTYYRSIGNTAVTYGTAGTTGAGTRVAVTNGSATVGGLLGTTWRASNRGRGDVITIPCDNPPTCTLPTPGVHYMILGVTTDNSLQLSRGYQGAGNPSASYVIRRQFSTLPAWEDCISGLTPACNNYFPVTGGNLVTEDRTEVGIAYKDSVFPPSGPNVNVAIDGSTTDALHTITLTADPGNRHNGIPGTGVILDGGAATDSAVLVLDDFVTVEWLEIRNGGSGFDGVEWQSIAAVNKGVARNLLVHGLPDNGIQIQDSAAIVDIYNNIVYQNGGGIRNVTALGTGSLRIFNNTIFGNGSAGGITGNVVTPFLITLRNNISHSNGGVGDYNIPSPNAASSHNISSDATATSVNPGGDNALWNGVPLAAMSFVSSGTGNLHIQAGSRAANAGVDLSAVFAQDVDGVVRLTPWEIGADDISQTTAVELLSFTAAPADGAVDVAWSTASELDNLGFHLYRSDGPEGPYVRLTPSLVPGLGSSPTGASYAWRDPGLVNGRTYYYELEDVETTGATVRHGPISATPSGGGGVPGGGGGGIAEGTAHGDPSAWSLREVERSDRHVVLELRTGGFLASADEDGSVRIAVPGFEESLRDGLPLKRAMVPAVPGRQVRLASVVATDEADFPGLVPAGPRILEVVATPEGGIVPSARRSGRRPGAVAPAVLAGTFFQGEAKKAEVDFSPVRFESGRLLLSGRIVVRLEFSPDDPQERALGASRGRRTVVRSSHRNTGVIARLAVGEAGLYGVSFEDLFTASAVGRTPRAMASARLRLSRQGEAVAYHLEPEGRMFGPGSMLFFHSEGSAQNPYGDAVYELEVDGEPLRMRVVPPPTTRDAVVDATAEARFEENRYYQAGLLEAPDLWLWDVLVSPSTGTYPFELTQVSPSPTPGQLVVDLQGASDFEGVVDHHLRFAVNGVAVGDAQWDGKAARRVALTIGAGVLHDGANELAIENVGDAGAAYSMVFLDRFAVRHPRTLVAQSGLFEGTTATSGRVEVQGLAASALVVDSTVAETRWVAAAPTAAGLVFSAEAGRTYLAGAPRRPRVLTPLPSSLKRPENQADYLVIGPRSFLDAAEPLLEHRRSQGLVSRAVSTEEVFQEFAFGENRPEAIKAFLEYAYQSWQKPSPRYVLLLGDATYDPKDYLGTGVQNRVPALAIKTSYLWTVSDPAYAAVNGDDLVPDVAIGRLPAGSSDEARRLVEKVLSYENGGESLDGPAVLVADNPDRAGDFEANANEIASTILAGRDPERIFVREHGALTRAAIVGALDGGLSLLSYVGHGATTVWAGENVFNGWDVPTLAPQPHQPLVLTLNCLNGFFHFPPLDSLGEAMVKAEGKGAIAALSPSGLSLDQSAHAFHKAVLREVASGGHARLGDAVLAAQQAYANEGALLELLSVYHLFGDPALVIR